MNVFNGLRLNLEGAPRLKPLVGLTTFTSVRCLNDILTLKFSCIFSQTPLRRAAHGDHGDVHVLGQLAQQILVPPRARAKSPETRRWPDGHSNLSASLLSSEIEQKQIFRFRSNIQSSTSIERSKAQSSPRDFSCFQNVSKKTEQ